MIVRDIEIIRVNIPVSKSLTLARIQPFVNTAEDVIKRTIGAAQYALLDAYERDDTNAYYDAVLKFIDASVCNLAYFVGFDMLNAIFSDQGIHRIETEAGDKKALFQRQELNIKDTLKITAYRNIDFALAYMETSPMAFAEWVDSPEYTLSKRNFINSTDEFQKYFDINESRILFSKLRLYQQYAEDFDIIAGIGSAYYNELKSQISAGTLSPENAAFLPYLQKAVANLSIGYAGQKFNFMLDDMGFRNTEHSNNTDNMRERKGDVDVTNSITMQTMELGKRYLNTSISFLKNNLTDYPTYANSDAYSSESLDRTSGTEKIIMI
jgi:hypothetical protein